MRRKRPSVQKYHDRVAGRYDNSYDDAFWQWHDALTWDYLRTYLPRNANAEVVDLGCGTGKWGLRLLKSGYRVTFVDISAEMLDQARVKAEPAGEKASFVQADLSDLSTLAEARFALAVAYGEPIGCTPSPPRTLREILRILEPGGVLSATIDNRLAALDFYLSSGSPAELSRFLREGRTHWLTKDQTERFPIVTYAPSELQDIVTAAGFEFLESVGKTILPMRQHRELLAESAAGRRWAAIEKTLSRDRDAIGRAPHIQFACRRAC